MTMQADRLFEVGSTLVRRDVFRGKVWTAWQCRVVADSGDQLALARWPGVPGLVPTTLLRSREDSRAKAIRTLAAGSWELGNCTWQHTTALILMLPGAYFSVNLFFRGNDFAEWYVNFERPFRRTPAGVDTLDLLLDLVIGPDRSYRWKDEDEYRQGRQLGIITDAEHRQVQRAREEVIALLQHGTGPFAEHWLTWRPAPEWATPSLPADAASFPSPAGERA
jgi:Protein of unknown function (DUF402)